MKVLDFIQVDVPQKSGCLKTIKSYWWQYPEANIFFNEKNIYVYFVQCIDILSNKEKLNKENSDWVQVGVPQKT